MLFIKDETMANAINDYKAAQQLCDRLFNRQCLDPEATKEQEAEFILERKKAASDCAQLLRWISVLATDRAAMIESAIDTIGMSSK